MLGCDIRPHITTSLQKSWWRSLARGADVLRKTERVTLLTFRTSSGLYMRSAFMATRLSL